jgi:hypothetical protein
MSSNGAFGTAPNSTYDLIANNKFRCGRTVIHSPASQLTVTLTTISRTSGRLSDFYNDLYEVKSSWADGESVGVIGNYGQYAVTGLIKLNSVTFRIYYGAGSTLDIPSAGLAEFTQTLSVLIISDASF